MKTTNTQQNDLKDNAFKKDTTANQGGDASKPGQQKPQQPGQGGAGKPSGSSR